MNQPDGQPHEDCLTKEDLAQRYRVTVRTIDNWMRVGMPYYKILKSVRYTSLSEALAKISSPSNCRF